MYNIINVGRTSTAINDNMIILFRPNLKLSIIYLRKFISIESTIMYMGRLFYQEPNNTTGSIKNF